MDDDVNTAGAVSVLFDLAREAVALREAGGGSAAAAFLHEAMTVIGLSPSERTLPPRRAQVELVETVVTSDRVASYVVRGPERDDGLDDGLAARLRAAVGDALSLDGAGARQAVDAVIVARAEAKADKNYALADALRKALADAGVVVTDSKEGATWTVGG